MSGGINSLILKIAERCNLNCSYCYMYHHEDKSYLSRPKFMSEDVFRHAMLRAREYCERGKGRRMNLSLHGGEPTLVGPRRMERFAQMARDILGEHLAGFCMQTNATLIDDDWIETIRRNDIAVGVSLDGPAHIHDAVRVDHFGRGSHDRVIRGLRLLQSADQLKGVLCVIDPGVRGADVYRYFRSLGVESMNFLIPDVTHDSKERLYGHYGATPVAEYLISVFDAWLEEDDPQVKPRVLRGLIGMMLGAEPESDAFGNPPMSYLVVESDGSIQALDTLRICQEGLPDSGLHVSRHGLDDLHLGLPVIHRLVQEGAPLSAQCRACPEAEVCAGGYLPHRYSRSRGFDNPSAWCPDILKLLAHIRAKTGIRNRVAA